jgi:CRP/FNR family cyclic AMP-dependent transcriptional regulator
MPLILEASAILENLASLPVATYDQGDRVLVAGQRTGRLYVLRDSLVEVVKDGLAIATVGEPGAVFGDLAVLLDRPHTADVRAIERSTFYVADGKAFLRVGPAAALWVAVVLAQRLDAANRHLTQSLRPSIEQQRQMNDPIKLGARRMTGPTQRANQSIQLETTETKKPRRRHRRETNAVYAGTKTRQAWVPAEERP